eukprot:gene27848-33629_t
MQDVIDGIRRAAFSRESSASSSSGVKVTHTMKSRWHKISTAIGISSKKLSSGIYEGCLDSFDFQRILDQWIKLCSLNNAPLLDMDKIVNETVKRSNQANSKEAKAKLDFSDCQLNDPQVQLLCRVLVANPKVVCIDIQANPLISSVGLYTVLQLQLAQVDAYRHLSGETSGARGLYLERVLYDVSSSLPPMLDEMIARCSAELQAINAKGYVRRLYDKYDVEHNATSDNYYKVFHKIVGSNLAEYQACLQEGKKSLSMATTSSLSYKLLEEAVIHGLRKAGMISEASDAAVPSDYSTKMSEDPVDQSSQPYPPSLCTTPHDSDLDKGKVDGMEGKVVDYNDLAPRPNP